MKLNKNTPNLSDAAEAIAKFANCPSLAAAQEQIEKRKKEKQDRKLLAEGRRKSEKNRRKGDYLKGINDATLITKGLTPSRLKQLPKPAQKVLWKNLVGGKKLPLDGDVNLPVPTEEMEASASATELEEVKDLTKAVHRNEQADAAPPLEKDRKLRRKTALITIDVKKLLDNQVTLAGNLKKFISRGNLRQLNAQHSTTPAPQYIIRYFDDISSISPPMSRNFASLAIAYAKGLITKEQFQHYFVQIPVIPPEEIQLLFNKIFQWR